MFGFAETSLRIIPEINYLWLTEGSQLKLDCICTQPKNATFLAFDFYKNGALIENSLDGFSLMTAMVVGPENAIATITLTKDISTFVDGGVYVCKTETGQLESMITVHYFSVSQTSGYLTDWATSLNLQCVPEGVYPSVDVKIAWVRNGNYLRTDGKYTVNDENGTLQINNPVRADVGEYICEVIFDEGSAEGQRFRPQPLFVADGTSPFIGDGTSSSVGDGTSPIIGEGTSPKPTTVAPLNSASTYFWITPMTSLYIVSFVKFVL